MTNDNRQLLKSQNAFGKLIADGTRNTIDVPSIYQFSPERLRLFQDGTRVTADNLGAKFTDNEGDWSLLPAANETLELSTAERPRYVVGYEAQLTTATRMTDTLGAGDTMKVGGSDKSDPENAVFFEMNGDSPNRLVIKKAGNELKTEEWVYPDTLDETKPIRYEIQYNAYGVGRVKFEISYTKENFAEQQNEVIGILSVQDEKWSNDYNFNIFQRIEASNSGLELRAGSFGFVVLGNIQETTRTKASRLTGLSYGGSGDYEPLAAMRIQAPEGNVYCQFKQLSVFPDATGGELLVNVFRPEETDASGFTVPPQQNESNTVVEQTTNVTEFTDLDGNTVTSDPDPAGYQVGFTQFNSAQGQGNTVRTATGQNIENKRPLYENDIAVFLYKADSATSDTISCTYLVEQDW